MKRMYKNQFLNSLFSRAKTTSLLRAMMIVAVMLITAGSVWAQGAITANIKDLQGDDVAVGPHVKGDFYCVSQPLGGGAYTWHHINKDAVDVAGVASVTWTNADIDAEVDLANNKCWFKVQVWAGDPFANTGVGSSSGLWSTFMLYDPSVANISWDVHTPGSLPPATVTSSGIYYNGVSDFEWQWAYGNIDITYQGCAHNLQPALSADIKTYMESVGYVFSFNATDGMLTITNAGTSFDQAYSAREDGDGGYIQEMERLDYGDVSYDAGNQRMVVEFSYVDLGLNDGDTFFCNLGFYVPLDAGPPAVYYSNYSTYTDVLAYAALKGYVGHTLDPLEVVAPVRNTNTGTGYFTIQGAIDDATAGDVIEVAAGTYDRVSENRALGAQGLINVNKGVTIIAATGARPIIDGTGVDGVFKIHPSALADGNTVRIEGFEITGEPATGKAMTMMGNYNIDPAHVVIHDNWFHGMIGGIDFWGVNDTWILDGYTSGVINTEITGNKFYDMGVTNVQQGFGVLIESPADWAAGNDYAVKIEDNEFSDIRSDGTDYGTGIGILDAGGSAINANVYVSGNTLENTVAVGIGVVNADVSTTKIEYNSFGNSVAIHATTISNGPINATCNWYGTAVGTEIAALIVGDVNYAPWLLTANLVTPDCNGGPAYNADTHESFDSAQEAIDAATAGDEIEIYYNPSSPLNIGKVLNIHYIFNEPQLP